MLHNIFGSTKKLYSVQLILLNHAENEAHLDSNYCCFSPFFALIQRYIELESIK